MEFRLLGTVEIVLGDRVVEVGPPQRRLVLAILAAEAGRPVSTERLVDRVWAEAPDGARRTLQVHISRIRRLLETPSTPVGVVRRSGGYLLDIDPDRVDVHRFQRLVNQARDRDRTEAEQLALLRTALELWRGTLLSDLPGRWAAGFRQSWQQRYLETVVAWALVCLRAGESGAVLPLLGELVGEHPLVEPLAAAYMRALYTAGRPADALTHYTALRHRLAEELGIDPGRELQQLHRQILAADPALGLPAAAAHKPMDPPRGTHVPAELPADVTAFTGRAEQLAHLDALLARADDQPNAVIISAMSGTAGVGKTALAIHWAHRNYDRFPDGQLYLNLRGYDPDQPVDPADALTRLLTVLGLTGQDVPHDLDERAARYRSELAGRRMLIMLDNAGSVEQVRPLLPGSGTCTVLVTSRDRLAGLVAIHGAHRLELDLLPPVETHALLRKLIGPRVDTEPEAATTLANHCARLPLALRVAAELATSRATTSLAEFVGELGDQQRRLDLLDSGGDPHAAVRTVFSWSIQHLPSDTSTMFRLLGLHPGPDIDPYAAAALADAGLDDARRRLELLSRAHLVQATGPGRYGMHDLLHAYAAELVHTHDAEQVRSAAQGRLLDHYRHTASVAMDTAYPQDHEHRPRIPPTDTPPPDLSDPNQATSWLDTEHPNLLATARHAAEHGWPTHTLDLSAILRRRLRTRGRYSDAEALHQLALTTARTVGDRAGELDALTGLGWVHVLQGRLEQAAAHMGQALQIARTVGDRAGVLDALRGLGQVHVRQGRHERATDHYRQALQIARTIGDRAGELNALLGLGHIHRMQGQHEQAVDHLRQVLEIARAIGNRTGELNALNGLAHILRLQGRHDQALDHNQQASKIARAMGNRNGVLAALNGLAHTYLLQSQYRRAADCYKQVLDLARESGERNWQFEALQGLGRLHHTTASPDAALTHYQQALQLATDLGQPHDQARAHDGLAHTHHALHQPDQAREHWQQALDILTKLGADHTEEQEASTSTIRAHLAALAER
jgi:DNA-binding SARP family transcriptional activator/Tfp pilus assembly protein PilF